MRLPVGTVHAWRWTSAVMVSDIPNGRGERAADAGAGGYNVLLLGPAGVGTSMLARRLTTVRPAMTLAEAVETTRIHSVAGLTGIHAAVVTTRPCRAPHQPISEVGVIGGGQLPRPGEASLAHHGILLRAARVQTPRAGGVAAAT